MVQVRSSIEGHILRRERDVLKWEKTPESTAATLVHFIESMDVGGWRNEAAKASGRWSRHAVIGVRRASRFEWHAPSLRRDSRIAGGSEAGGARDRRAPP